MSPTPSTKKRNSRWQSLNQLVWANRVARAQRNSVLNTSRPTLIAVAALDNRMLTTPVSALLGILVNEVSDLPVALIDADTIAQPLRGPLGARSGGDLYGLLSNDSRNLRRERIEQYADLSGSVPLLSASLGTRHRLDPLDLDTLLPRVQHRWPTVILDLPFTLTPETITAGTVKARHVILVADRHHLDHSWLYQEGHHLTDAAREGRVTVVSMGGPLDNLPADTVSLPPLDLLSTSRTRLAPSTKPEDISMYHRLLFRIF